MIIDFTIDEEFQSLIPPLTEDEYQQLESNLGMYGCRDSLVVWSGVLVDGHNRYEVCKKHGIGFSVIEMEFADRSHAKEWIINNQFGRRNLSLYTRTELALKLEELISERAKENQRISGGDRKSSRYKSVPLNSAEPIKTVDTREEVAKAAKVSNDTVSKVKKINKAIDAGLVPEETVAKLRSGDVSVNRVARDIDESKKKAARDDQRKEAAATIDPVVFDNIHVGDFREHFDKVADNSLSLIFTDPPYDRKACELFEPLAEFAESKLCEGGSLLAYIGHIQMAEAMSALSSRLRYWWTVCCLHSGGESLMTEYGIRVGWKPVLWFVKGTRDDKLNIVKDVMSGGREKSHHDWQQSQSEAEYWIQNLCPDDGVVCDPFLGGGTTAVAAIACGRKWIGFEKNADQAALAMSRIDTRGAA